MVGEKLIDKKQALLRIDPSSLDQLLHPTFDPAAARNVITKGLPALARRRNRPGRLQRG